MNLLLLIVLPIIPIEQYNRKMPLVTQIAIMNVGITSVVDLGVTEYYIGRDILREANPFLRKWEHAPVKMGFAKASLTAAQILILKEVEEKSPKWTLVTAIGINILNVWAIRHNIRESR